MGRWLFPLLLLCAASAAQEALIPAATETPGRPFAIRNKWVIGGAGNWDYLTLDPVARQLFVTHQTQVQVVELDSGTIVGTVSGFQEAHAVVLDPGGNDAYVSDGRANKIRVFNRRSFEVESDIDAGCSPRSLAYEPQTQLLFAICSAVIPIQPNAPNGPRRAAPVRAPELNPQNGYSHIVAIDPETKRALANVLVPGDYRNVRADGAGLMFVTVGESALTDPQYGGRRELPAGVARVDAAAIAAEARRLLQAMSQEDRRRHQPAQWEEEPNRGDRVRLIHLDPECGNPQGLDIATRPLRLFVGCSDQRLEILNADTGSELAALTTGPGTDVVAFDANHDLIFAANGGGYGSLTIVRHHVTDTYNVIQNLPTLQQARTAAVDPSTGEVYLVTTLYGANLKNPPRNGIGTLKMEPVDGSFQVLVIGN